MYNRKDAMLASLVFAMLASLVFAMLASLVFAMLISCFCDARISCLQYGGVSFIAPYRDAIFASLQQKNHIKPQN